MRVLRSIAVKTLWKRERKQERRHKMSVYGGNPVQLGAEYEKMNGVNTSTVQEQSEWRVTNHHRDGEV